MKCWRIFQTLFSHTDSDSSKSVHFLASIWALRRNLKEYKLSSLIMLEIRGKQTVNTESNSLAQTCLVSVTITINYSVIVVPALSFRGMQAFVPFNWSIEVIDEPFNTAATMSCWFKPLYCSLSIAFRWCLKDMNIVNDQDLVMLFWLNWSFYHILGGVGFIQVSEVDCQWRWHVANGSE